MSTPVLAESFLQTLEQSGLIAPPVVSAALQKLGLPDSAPAERVAGAFIAAGLITNLQAERLLEGRRRGYFIDRFKLLEILGSGGMATLYLAEEKETRRKVALKVLSENHKSDPSMLARLKLEALAGKRLKHPNIVHTEQLGYAEDVFGETCYVVMEFIEGINLEELVNLRGRLPWAQACELIRQTALGLQHAHEQGLVHRDIKAANLLIDHDGNARLLDFGLALIDADVTADEFSLAMIFGHSCLGTADYIAPEQSVDSYSVDARADIYSLGCTLYVALSGRLPFPMASSCEKIEGHRTRPVRPLRESAPDVPAELAALVDKMMAKTPEARHQSAAEVAAALAPFARRLPVDFNFKSVLQARATAAQKRASRFRKPGSTAGGSSGRLADGTPARSRQSSVETAVAKDTAVRREAPQAPHFSPPAAEVQILSRGGAAQAADADAWLIPTQGGPPLPLVGPRVLIGRDTDCDVRITSPQVSGKHCELRRERFGWRVRDLKSTNGVQINGKPVKRKRLSRYDRLTIAREFEFRIARTPDAPAPARWRRYVLPLLLILAGLAAAAAWWLGK
jgi:eukaryotic-like serine/threonine-protein kinase